MQAVRLLSDIALDSRRLEAYRPQESTRCRERVSAFYIRSIASVAKALRDLAPGHLGEKAHRAHAIDL